MSDTPPGESAQSGRVGHEPRPEDTDDATAVAPPPSDDTPTSRTVPLAKGTPARDEMARTPVPYAPAPVPTPQTPPPPPGYQPPAYPPPPGYPQTYAPPAYPPPAPFPTTGYVPQHAYDPPAPPYAPEPFVPAPDPTQPAPLPAYPAPAAPLPPGYTPPVRVPPTPKRMDGVATASLIVSVLGIPLIVVACLGIPFCITGIIMGFVARHRIALSEGKLTGEGVALAAILIGAAGIAFFVLLFLSFMVPGRSSL